MPIGDDNLDDDLRFERVESFGGGVDAYRRSTLIDPDQSQLLENMLIRDNYEARTRPGIESIGPLASPTRLVASVVSKTRVDLSWVFDAPDLPDMFGIERGLSPSGPFTAIGGALPAERTYQDLSCSPNTTYYYRVLAVYAAANSPYSNVASSTTLPPAPSAPTGLTVTPISTAQLNLAWLNPVGSVVDTIKVYRSFNGDPFTLMATLSNTTQAYSDTSVGDGTYYYKITATNVSGSTDSTTIPGVPFPSAPSGLSATPISGSQIDLSWSNNSPTQTSVIVSRATSVSGPYSDIATLGNVTAYSDTGLTNGTQYWYQVRVRNGTGDSAASGIATATTVSPPVAPSSLVASAAGSTELDLSWVNNAGNADNVQVLRSATSGSGFAVIATLASSATTYADTGLNPAETWFYKVRAINTAGTADSAEVNFTTWSDIVTMNVNSPTPINFGSFPRGTYLFYYLTGCLQYGAGFQWSVNYSTTPNVAGFRVKYDNLGTQVEFNVNGFYATEALAVAGNQGNPAKQFINNVAGIVAIYLLDSNYADNVASPTFGAPKFQLRRIA